MESVSSPVFYGFAQTRSVWVWNVLVLDQVRPVRIRREVIKCRYLQGKHVYKYDQLVLTIPSRFKELVEPFVGRDLKVEASHEGNSLVIKAKLIESIVRTNI